MLQLLNGFRLPGYPAMHDDNVGAYQDLTVVPVATLPKTILMAPQWLNTSEYPFRSRFFNIAGHSMHYVEEGSGHTLLFVHGTPSWSFDYRNVIKHFSSHFRCVAIDHIGFGLSDKPSGYDYSTQNHSRTLERFVKEKGLDNITLVVHDFGGPIGFDFATRNPHKIKHIVVLNSWLWNSDDDPAFRKMRRVLRSPLLPFLYRSLNFSPRFLLPSSFGEHKLPPYLLSQYTRPFANAGQRNGPLAFARSLLHDQAWFQDIWGRLGELTQRPTLFIWGMKDKFVAPLYLDKFQERFTNSKTLQLPTCGHFPQEEQPDEVVKAIRQFLEDNQ